MAWAIPTTLISEVNLGNAATYTMPGTGSVSLVSGRLYIIFVRQNHSSTAPDFSSANTLVGASDQGAFSPTYIGQCATMNAADPGRFAAFRYIADQNRTTVTFVVDQQALGNCSNCWFKCIEIASGFDATTPVNQFAVNAADDPDPSQLACNLSSAPESDALSLLGVMVMDNTSDISTPSGWTLLGTELDGSGSLSDSGAVSVFYRDPATQNVTVDATGGTTNDYGVVHLELNAETASNDRRALVTWAEMEAPNAPRRALVTWAEMEAPNAPRRALVTWAEMEVPTAPRRSHVTWAEMEVPDAPRRAHVTWAEMEAPDAPRRSHVTWAEMEVPTAPRRAVVTWAEFETPDAPTDRRARVTWAEMEVPDAPRRSHVTWAEMEVPDAPRRVHVTWAEMEVPPAPRRAHVTWAEMEAPDAPRRAVVTWAEMEVPDAPGTDRRAIITWAEFEAPDTAQQAAGRRRARAFEEEWARRRRAIIFWAELEVPDRAVEGVALDAPEAAFETVPAVPAKVPAGALPRVTIPRAAPVPPPPAPRRALITWAILEVPDQDDRARIVLLRQRLDNMEEEMLALTLLLREEK